MNTDIIGSIPAARKLDISHRVNHRWIVESQEIPYKNRNKTLRNIAYWA